MLEGSFRPPSAPSAPVHLHLYSQPQSQPVSSSSAYPADQALARRKDISLQPHNRGPSFTPIPHHHHSPGYDTDDHPPSPQPRFYNHQPPQPPSAFRASEPSAPQPPKSDSRPSEPAAKDPSFGPVRAKKKPAGSACNSCHRLKTRCSGGYPCDRCAAHKVPCQFDRDLIYRSPLASSSQQASARNAQVLNQVNGKLSEPIIVPTKPPRARSNNSNGTPKLPTKRPAPTPPVQQQPQQPPQQIPPSNPVTALPTHVETVAQLPRSTPSPVPLRQAQQPQALAHPSSGPRKQAPPKSTNPAPAPSDAFVTYDPSTPAAVNHAISLRLSALENNLAGILQILRPQASHAHPRLVMPDQIRPPSPTPAPLILMPSSSSAIGPERDRQNDSNRLGHAGSGDQLIDAILDPTQIQYLYDIFVDYCLPSLPILHRVQLSMIRARSPFLFSAMLAIGARFCSTQSVAHPSSSLAAHSVNSSPSPIGSHPNAPVIDESTYARLVTLAYQHLSSTVLKSCHSLDDVRAILFLACWALVSNDDGPPSRWVLVGHAARIGRSMGLERLARDLNGSGGWANPQQHAMRRDQLDAIKTDYALRSMEAFLSTTLRLEPTRDYFPKAPSPGCSKPNIVQLATGSPFQYDILSTAQIQAMVELAEIWADATGFLAAAEDRHRKLSAEQLVDLGERHNTLLDGWAQKWTWHGSSWAPLLGNNLRTVRLLSESLRITLNLALTNVLYACITAAAGNTMFTTRFQETLSIALERVSGSSTAVIQAHRDSAREGFSLAFAPDLITDGLVSAALTVLQLATPFVQGVGRVPASTTSGGPLLAEEDRPTTPSEKGDVEMSDVTTTTTNKSSSARHQPTNTTNSSPATSPDGGDQSSHSGDSLGKKPLMEPAVAAHYIRMATDVLRTSDRSQTRLGTTMACKIMSLAGRAGLLPGVVVGAQNQQQQHHRAKMAAVERKGDVQEHQQQEKKRRRSEESVEEGPSRVQGSSAHGGDEDGGSSRRRRSVSSGKMREEDEDVAVMGDHEEDDDEDEQAAEQDEEEEEEEDVEEETEDHLLTRNSELEQLDNGSDDDDEILGEHDGVEDDAEDKKMIQEGLGMSHNVVVDDDEKKTTDHHMECEDNQD